MTADTLDEILRFAIKEEEGAARFYSDLARKATRPEMRQVFEEFAREELRHKERLVAVKQGKPLLRTGRKVTDLKIGDFLIDVQPGPDLDYREALIVAMKKEEAAVRMYTALAETMTDEHLRATFLALAEEERGHKLRFETEYDSHVLTDL